MENNNINSKQNNKIVFINGKLQINTSTPISRPLVTPEIISSRTLNVIDLFCGCGGMSKGLTDAGLNIIAGIDIWDKAINSYKQNYHHTAICEDLTKLPPERFNKLYNTDNKIIDLIVGGPPCFIAGTKVLTNTGYKNIEEVKLTDKLLTHTGIFQKICNLQNKLYNGDLYDINIKYHGDIITCTEEHPFYVREKENNLTFGKPVWKEAKYLNQNDYFGMVINTNSIIPNFTINKINIILDKPEFWYILGYYICNGSCLNNKIYFSIPEINKKEIIEKINIVIQLYDKNSKCYNENNYYICENIIWNNIFKMLGEDTYNIIIPEWIYNAPQHLIQKLINGYMHTYESYKNNKSCNLAYNLSYNLAYNLSYNLAYGIQRLFLKLKKIISINKIQNKYSINIKNDIDKNDIAKNDIAKNEDLFIENNYAWFKLSSINKKENIKKENINVPVYNFEVENDNSYIVYNTIVHNCQGMSIAGKRDINDPRNSLFIEYVKYLDYFNPKAFIMENVIGILSMKTANNESVIDIIMKSLTKKYNCIICKLYASDFEVPQNRRRTIIIGIRKDLNIIPIEPKPVLTVENRKPVSSILLPKEEVDSSYYLSTRALEGIIAKKTKARENHTGFGAQFLDVSKPSYTIPARYWKDGYDALVKYNDLEIRRLTILELKRIQSFPDDYIIEGTKKDIIMQIGNAVACRFAFHLGKYIINTLHLE